MSYTDYSQIFFSRDGRQDRRIRALQDDLSDAYSQMHRERSRMRSELSRVRGTLEQRLDRVSATLDAFIELSDVRATLAMFDHAAIARHRTLQLLDGTPMPSLDLRDVPGYWLVPAARGLHSLLADDVSRARLHFDEASRIDAPRARSFAALSCALTRAEHARSLGESVSADLLPRLPGPDTQVTRGQRALWMLTADGSFGDDPREHLLLSTLRGWSAEGERAPAVDAWSVPDSGGRVRGPNGRNSPRVSATADPQRRAARGLAELREQITGITAPDGGIGSPEALSPDRDSSDFLWETLRLLVEEGSREEAPLLLEANRLRAVIENNGEAGTPAAWGDDLGTASSLLLRDLTREDAPPHRRTFSLVLLRTAVLDTAQDLAARAGEQFPAATDLRLHGTTVTLTSSGADRQQVEEARRRLRQRAASEGGTGGVLWGVAAVTGVMLLLSLATGNTVLWTLTVAGAAAAAYVFFAAEREKGDAEAVLRLQERKLDQQVEEAVQEWRRTRVEAEEHAAEAHRELEAIRSLLDP